MKKLIAISMAILLSLTLIASCGGQDSGTGDDQGSATPSSGQDSGTSGDQGSGASGGTDEGGMTYRGHDVSAPMTLVAYVLGDMREDTQMVHDAMNEHLKGTINATIDWRFLSWGEHGDMYPLLFTSQEDFDIIFTAPNWAHYETTVGMNGLEPMVPELVQTYAPDLWEIIPEEAWLQLMIEGVPYAVPSAEANLRSDVFAMRGDLMQKAGVEDITTYEALVDYLNWVAANPDQTGGASPFGRKGGGMLYSYFYQNGLQRINGMPYEYLFYDYTNPNNTEVIYLLETDWFRDYCLKMVEHYEAGWWSQDSLAPGGPTFQEEFQNGHAVTFGWNIGSVMNFLLQTDETYPEWDVTFVDPEINGLKFVENYNNNNLALNAFGKQKERAMMALNELYTNIDVNRLLRYGVEGVHYNLLDDVYYSPIEGGASRYMMESNCAAWAAKNPAFKLTTYIENPTSYQLKEQEIRQIWEQNRAPYHPVALYSIDTTNITSQIAMVDQLTAEYYTPLVSGMAGSDVDAAIEALRTQMEQAGIRTIIDEVNRQIAARVAG